MHNYLTSVKPVTFAVFILFKQNLAHFCQRALLQIWRRSYDTRPPPMTSEHPYYSSIRHDPRYASSEAGAAGPTDAEFPFGESLKDTMERVLPFWHSEVAPRLRREGTTLLMVAHGTSIRGMVKHINAISSQDILKLEIPTGAARG